jgi:hypothetical protein
MYKKGIKVIASTAIPQGVVNQTMVSDTAPKSRNNGGTLRQGDRWWQPIRNTEHIWIVQPDDEYSGAWIEL